MAKLTVVTNAAGEIIGTAAYTGEPGAPTMARLVGGPGQTVHEVDVADELLKLPPAELHLRLQHNLLSTVRTQR
jgi:hypothetical protein